MPRHRKRKRLLVMPPHSKFDLIYFPLAASLEVLDHAYRLCCKGPIEPTTLIVSVRGVWYGLLDRMLGGVAPYMRGRMFKNAMIDPNPSLGGEDFCCFLGGRRTIKLMLTPSPTRN